MHEVSSLNTTGVTSNFSSDINAAKASKSDHDSMLEFTQGLPALEVHQRARAARSLQGKAHHLLAHWLLEVDERKLYLELGSSSVYQYAELSLHLEGHTVAEYLRTARALKHFPLLSEAYQSGSLSASKLREITRVVTKETEPYWLDVARNSTTRQIEKREGAVRPRGAAGPGSWKYITSGRSAPAGPMTPRILSCSARPAMHMCTRGGSPWKVTHPGGSGGEERRQLLHKEDPQNWLE